MLVIMTGGRIYGFLIRTAASPEAHSAFANIADRNTSLSVEEFDELGGWDGHWVWLGSIEELIDSGTLEDLERDTHTFTF